MEEHPLFEQDDACPAIRLPLQQFEAMDKAFRSSQEHHNFTLQPELLSESVPWSIEPMLLTPMEWWVYLQ